MTMTTTVTVNDAIEDRREEGEEEEGGKVVERAQ